MSKVDYKVDHNEQILRWYNMRACQWMDSYFEEPEIFDFVYNDVLNCLVEKQLTYSSNSFFSDFEIYRFTNFIRLLYFKGLTDDVKRQQFEKLFNIFLCKYMNSLLEFLFVEDYFYVYGLGYCFKRDGYSLNRCIKESSLEDIFGTILMFLRKYFMSEFESEFKFRERFKFGCSILEDAGEEREDFREQIPEKYRAFISEYDMNNNEGMKNVFINCLDKWWNNLKGQCRYYLRVNGVLPSCGNGLLGNFSSLEELIKKINDVRVLLGYEALSVEGELNELNQPLEFNPAHGIPYSNRNSIGPSGDDKVLYHNGNEGHVYRRSGWNRTPWS